MAEIRCSACCKELTPDDVYTIWHGLSRGGYKMPDLIETLCEECYDDIAGEMYREKERIQILAWACGAER